MKTSTLRACIYAALVLSAVTSCEKDNTGFGRTGSDAISMGSVKTTSPLTKAATVDASREVTLEDGSSFTITKSIEPYISAPETKVDLKEDGNLSSFALYGYLDADEIAKAEGASATDKANNNFIPSANVGKGGDGLWHTDNPYYWRNSITHYFWAQSGAESMTTTASTASFVKSSSSEEDIIVAYTSKKWNESMCNEHAGDKLDLNFSHALSALKFGLGTIAYKQHNAGTGAISDAQADRVDQGDMSLIRMTEGNCTVNNALEFNWDELKTNDAKNIAENEVLLAIPQNSAALQIIYTDNYRTVTRPVVIPLNDNWASGHLYNYTINGTVTVPELGDDQIVPGGGIKTDFIGNEKRSEPITTSIDVTYYKKLEISWDNLPKTNGNGTYAFVYYGTEKLDVNDVDGMKSNAQVLFMYDAFKNGVGVIKIVGGSVKDGHVTCTLDATNLTGVTNIYVGYNGGSNSKDQTNWIIKNLNIKVLEYK